jgi:hypothetical protein
VYKYLGMELISLVMSVFLPFHMEHLCPHPTDFYEILYLNIFRKSVENIQFSLKSDKNNGRLALRHMYIDDNISLNYS